MYPFKKAKLNDCGGKLSARWYIEFSAWNVQRSLMVRKRFYEVNNIPSAKERRLYASRIIQHLNKLLSEGYHLDSNKFIYCQFGDYFPAKRLTPKTINLPNGQVINITINTNKALGIYNKQTKSLSFCKPTSTDNPLYTSGIYNDIDAGPSFFPMKQVNDSTMMMWIRTEELIDHVKTDDFKNNIPKYPEKKKHLEQLTDTLTALDNPVLMFVTFRKL